MAAAAAAADLYLPDECWECVFRFVNGDHHCYLKPLSLVSKQFLTITNRLRFSLRISGPTLPFLPRLFHRFPNLTSLDLTRFRGGDRDALLFQISRYPLRLISLNLSKGLTIPANGYSYAGIFCLLSSKCQFLQHLDLQHVEFLNDQRVAELSSLFLGNLVSINVSGCKMLTHSAFIALVRNCPLLSKIRMEETGIGKNWGVANDDSNSLMDFVVNPHHQVKSLYLGFNSWLRDETIKMIAFICPNLQLLDLFNCCGISEGVVEVLRRCCKIRHLNLAFCSGVKLLGMNFEVPKLEVLNLSHSRIDDEALHVISKCCCGLLQLDLENCSLVTAKGVKDVVESCTQLREINLRNCRKVAANVVAWMVLSRPSLRKIQAPPSFRPSVMDALFSSILEVRC